MLKYGFPIVLLEMLAIANSIQINQPSASIELVGLRDTWCSSSETHAENACPDSTLSSGDRVTYGLTFQSILASKEEWSYTLQLEASDSTGRFAKWSGLTFQPAQLCVSNWQIKLSGQNVDSAKNLNSCTGECDSDAQCASGLKCFQREKGESIPGCTGNGGGPTWDYCYDPNFKKATSSKCSGDPSKGDFADCITPAIGNSWIKFHSPRLVRWSNCTGAPGQLTANATIDSVDTDDSKTGLTTLFSAGSFGALPYETITENLGTELRLRFRAHPVKDFCMVQEGARCKDQVVLESKRTQAACALEAKANGHSFFVWAQSSKSCAVLSTETCIVESQDDSVVLSFDCDIGSFCSLIMHSFGDAQFVFSRKFVYIYHIANSTRCDIGIYAGNPFSCHCGQAFCGVGVSIARLIREGHR